MRSSNDGIIIQIRTDDGEHINALAHVNSPSYKFAEGIQNGDRVIANIIQAPDSSEIEFIKRVSDAGQRKPLSYNRKELNKTLKQELSVPEKLWKVFSNDFDLKSRTLFVKKLTEFNDVSIGVVCAATTVTVGYGMSVGASVALFNMSDSYGARHTGIEAEHRAQLTATRHLGKAFGHTAANQKFSIAADAPHGGLDSDLLGIKNVPTKDGMTHTFFVDKDILAAKADSEFGSIIDGGWGITECGVEIESDGTLVSGTLSFTARLGGRSYQSFSLGTFNFADHEYEDVEGEFLSFFEEMWDEAFAATFRNAGIGADMFHAGRLITHPNTPPHDRQTEVMITLKLLEDSGVRLSDALKFNRINKTKVEELSKRDHEKVRKYALTMR